MLNRFFIPILCFTFVILTNHETEGLILTLLKLKGLGFVLINAGFGAIVTNSILGKSAEKIYWKNVDKGYYDGFHERYRLMATPHLSSFSNHIISKRRRRSVKERNIPNRNCLEKLICFISNKQNISKLEKDEEITVELSRLPGHLRHIFKPNSSLCKKYEHTCILKGEEIMSLLRNDIFVLNKKLK